MNGRSERQGHWLHHAPHRWHPPQSHASRVRVSPPAARVIKRQRKCTQRLSCGRFEMDLTPLVHDHCSFIAGLPDSVHVSIRNYISSSAVWKKLQMETQSESLVCFKKKHAACTRSFLIHLIAIPLQPQRSNQPWPPPIMSQYSHDFCDGMCS